MLDSLFFESLYLFCSPAFFIKSLSQRLFGERNHYQHKTHLNIEESHHVIFVFLCIFQKKNQYHRTTQYKKSSPKPYSTSVFMSIVPCLLIDAGHSCPVSIQGVDILWWLFQEN